jgi:hypothetical protein
LVKLLTNICNKIDSVNYPGQAGLNMPATERFHYLSTQNPNQRDLAGGKALYFLARGFLEYEAANGPGDALRMQNYKEYRNKARITIANLKEEIKKNTPPFTMDTYGMAYLMRAITIYIRSYANARDATYSQEMLGWAQEIMSAMNNRVTNTRSRYYGPLTRLQFLAEIGYSRSRIN